MGVSQVSRLRADITDITLHVRPKVPMFKDSRLEGGPAKTVNNPQKFPTVFSVNVIFCLTFEVHLEILINADKTSSSIHYRTL